MKNGVYYNYDDFIFNKCLLWVKNKSGWNVSLRPMSTDYNFVKKSYSNGWGLGLRHKKDNIHIMPLELLTW